MQDNLACFASVQAAQTRFRDLRKIPCLGLSGYVGAVTSWFFFRYTSWGWQCILVAINTYAAISSDDNSCRLSDGKQWLLEMIIFRGSVSWCWITMGGELMMSCCHCAAKRLGAFFSCGTPINLNPWQLLIAPVFVNLRSTSIVNAPPTIS